MASRYLGHEMLDRRSRRAHRACRSAPRTRANSALTGSSTPSPPRARFASACIVVDFGTAITYDVVSGDGEYLGGIISPGMEISLEALSSRAAKLPQIELGEPRSLIGSTTADAVRSGIVYGFAGQVDASSAGCASSSASRPRRSPPAGSPTISCRRSRRRSTPSTTC